MKRLIIIVLSIFAFAAAASAQSKAIGGRFGWGGEVSYQHYLGGSNFLEADLGFNGGLANGFYLTGVYNFNFADAGDFSFYAGPGAQLGVRNVRNSDNTAVSSFGLAIVGQIGCEYAIPVAPINISLDWRPAFFITRTAFGWEGLCLGIRYRF